MPMSISELCQRSHHVLCPSFTCLPFKSLNAPVLHHLEKESQVVCTFSERTGQRLSIGRVASACAPPQCLHTAASSHLAMPDVCVSPGLAACAAQLHSNLPRRRKASPSTGLFETRQSSERHHLTCVATRPSTSSLAEVLSRVMHCGSGSPHRQARPPRPQT